MKDYVIALQLIGNKKNELVVVTKDYFEKENLGSVKYEFVDDSSSEYKAQIKLKEIKSIGIENYRSMHEMR